MALKASTGLRNAMLGTTGFKTALALGFIKVYSGTVPTDADAAVTGTLLGTVTQNSDGTTGLTLAASASGAISKNGSPWGSATGSSGVASYWRFVAVGDTGALSTTEARLQGLASTSGSELVMANTNISSGVISIDYFSVALPA
jgi:hypothetical protein